MYFFNQLKNKLQSKLEFQPTYQLTTIIQHLYHIPYPNQQLIQQLKPQILQLTSPTIYNISQYQYQQDIFGDNVNIKTFHYQYFTSLPLCVMLDIIDQINITIKKGHDVVIHCQDNNSRSAILLVLYLYVQAQCQLSMAIIRINTLLHLEVLLISSQTNQQTIFRTQHTYLKNIANYWISPTEINPNQIHLIKIILSRTPNLSTITPTKIMIEIKSSKHLQSIFKKIYQLNQMEGYIFMLSSYNIKLTDDFLIHIKYVSNNKAYPLLRMQLNTNFMKHQLIRIHPHEMDLSQKINIQSFFIDIIFQNGQSLSQLTKRNNHPKLITSQTNQSTANQALNILEKQPLPNDDQFEILGEDSNNQVVVINQQLQNKLKLIQKQIDYGSEEDDEQYFKNLESLQNQ